MIDSVQISVKSGNGGRGAVSGRREKFIPYGGPDGGDGGNGGTVFIRGDAGVNTLLAFRYERRFEASSGRHGMGKQRHGAKGDDVEIVVPVGTEVWSDKRSALRLADLNEDGEIVDVAKGGKGGRGNVHFKTSTNQFPLLAEDGELGEDIELRLELKLLADVGIVGVPNAGKSSLLAAVSSAKPKIAEYPFTTLEPVLGVVDHRGDGFVMVDIPGLIEGAHSGVGLGDEFLRHVERTSVLIHVLDSTSENPVADYRKVRTELELFDERLLTRPEVVAINKMDIEGTGKICQDVQGELAGEVSAVRCISAAGRAGLSDLVGDVWSTLVEARRDSVKQVAASPRTDIPVLRPQSVDRPRPRVRKRGERYFVASKQAARVARAIDSQNWNARVQFYEYLRRLGVVSALEEAGIEPGDMFVVGKLDLEWE